jgi:hypothetical protein
MYYKNFIITLIIIVFFLFNISKSYGGGSDDDIFLGYSLELNKSYSSFKDINPNYFENYKFKNNISDLNDIAIGASLKLFKLGFNLNWLRTSVKSDNLLDNNRSKEQVKYNSNQFNLTTFFYYPILKEEKYTSNIFLETGLTGIFGKTSYKTSSQLIENRSVNQIVGLYGFGTEITYAELFDKSILHSSSDRPNAVRLSIHRFTEKIRLLDNNITEVRIGYLRSFF